MDRELLGSGGLDDMAEPPHGLTRRTFLGFVVAAPTLMAGVQFGPRLLGTRANAAVPSPPEPADLYDLTDMLTDVYESLPPGESHAES